jgi:hypothetical protein
VYIQYRVKKRTNDENIKTFAVYSLSSNFIASRVAAVMKIINETKLVTDLSDEE